MTQRSRSLALPGTALAILLAACAQTPMGPTVPVMPGTGKSFDAFQNDQATCKQYAQQAVSGQAENANLRGLGAAAVTTAIGAGLGGAIGGGRGAGIGAAGGALGGAGIGGAGSSHAQGGIQVQYDNAFAQCMFAKGNIVPGFGQMTQQQPVSYPDPELTKPVQTQLIRLGFLSPPADGVLGPRTQQAISSFEGTAGLPADGTPSAALLARLEATP